MSRKRHNSRRKRLGETKITMSQSNELAYSITGVYKILKKCMCLAPQNRSLDAVSS